MFTATFFSTLRSRARMLLAILASLVVVWAFGVVIARSMREMFADRRQTQLTLLHWGTPQETAIVQQLCERYMATHPDVSILRIQATDFEAKLKTMIAAGTPPDLFYLPPQIMPGLAREKLIRPIDEFVARDAAAGRGGYLDEYYPILLEMFRYDVAGDGPVAARSTRCRRTSRRPSSTSTSTSSRPPACRCHMAAGRGTSSKSPPARSPRSTAGPSSPAAGFTAAILRSRRRRSARSSGASAATPSAATSATSRSARPPLRDALKMIARLRLHDRTVYNATGLSKDAGEEFLNGNICCTGPLGRWRLPILKDITRFRWDCVPVPTRTPGNRAAMLHGTGWAMSATAPKPEACFELMKFLCGPDGAAMQSRLGLAIPPIRRLAEGSDFTAAPSIPPIHHEAFLNAIPFARVQQLPEQTEWLQIVNDMIPRSLQLGQATPAENARDSGRVAA